MYRLRQATEDDFDFLFSLHRDSMRVYVEPIWGWHEDWQEEYFRKKFDARDRKIIVIDGRDAGVLVVEERLDEIHIGLIEILPEFQGRGIGTMILTHLTQEATTRQTLLCLHVLKTNQPAKRFYERLGFRIIEEEMYRLRMVFEPKRP